ncbi:MAG TPA: regulatory iron-sulfur-containing complex subunit RicT [Kofleriaceae bacterium]|jgi:cell fate regulator YaaT (PSP1 superfamily)
MTRRRRRRPEHDGPRTSDLGLRTPESEPEPSLGSGDADDQSEVRSPKSEVPPDDEREPAPAIVLAPDLPPDPPATDPDPASYELAGAQLGDDVAAVIGVRFVSAGRIQWCDAGDGDFTPGERVMVDSDRGPRLATVATPATRRAVRERGLRRVIRRAHEGDQRATESTERELRIAKDKAAELGLQIKVFRVEKTGGKLFIYYTSDDRVDVRAFVRDVGAATNSRLELRQLGARDEAKVIGGIGSCGLTLCCTTWLPEFVPVSIKMAKDQGLVLSPTKVSGQCGRLKCCLVYEQAAYAELRKGLPKLGKRVVTARGEGRVVEVDVLRQRIRVSYAPGEAEVLPAADVKPMFASQHPQHEHEPEAEPEPESEP